MVTVAVNGSDAATIVVSDVQVLTQSQSQFGSPPQEGVFKFATVTVRNTGGDTFDVNPFEFYLRGADGTKYDFGNGNSLMATDKSLFDATTLNPGEQRKGLLIFDVPPSARELVYAPTLTSRVLAVWTIP